MNFHLLAETEIPAQLILFGIVLGFSFLKWLFQKITGAGQQPVERDEDVLESLYDSYRETIRQRQSGSMPPNLPEQNAWGEPIEEEEPQASPEPFATTESTSYKFDPDKLPQKLEVAPPIEINKKRKSRQSGASILNSLQNKSELRKAILMKEILQKPKALRD